MKPIKLSATVVKRSIKSHSSLGLATGALMYLVCLTGTLAVFFEEFERWEQPRVEEYQSYSVEQIETAVGEFRKRVTTLPEEMWVVLPTDAVPRMHISGNDQEWFINADGSLAEPPTEGWTSMVTSLHLRLHLPKEFGLLLVGILGVVLCSLTLSGFLAHPSVLKDAFRWRTGRQALTQLDLHNRLSVWAAPFYLMIALSGAFIGISGVFGALTGVAFYDSDFEKVTAAVYGDDPVVTDSVSVVDYGGIFNSLKEVAPTATALFLRVQNLDKEDQFVEVFAALPGRLIYSETYQFHSNGTYIGHKEFSDGEVGKQLAYSVYRIHFGHFEAFWVKLVYAVLGLALTIVCVSGINIWLVKRKFESALNDVWASIVWGLPLALAMSALLVLYGGVPLLVFCTTQIVATGFGLVLKDPNRTRWALMAAFALCLGAVVLTRTMPVLGESVTNTFYAVNGGILMTLLVMIGLLVRRRHWLLADKSSRSSGDLSATEITIN